MCLHVSEQLNILGVNTGWGKRWLFPRVAKETSGATSWGFS